MMHDGMQYDRSKVKVTAPTISLERLKLESSNFAHGYIVTNPKIRVTNHP